MATTIRTTYTCDNCEVVLAEGVEASTFKIGSNGVSHSVDLCETCAEKVTTLQHKGVLVPTMGRPPVNRPQAVRLPGKRGPGRPRKIEAVVAVDDVALPEFPAAPVVEVETEVEAAPAAAFRTVGEMFGDGDDIPSVPFTPDSDPEPTYRSVPQSVVHPAFAAPASDGV